MKKLALLFLFSPFSLVAQIPFGIYGGISYNDTYDTHDDRRFHDFANSINGTSTKGDNSYISLNMGAFINFSLTGVLSFQPEISFIKQGYRSSYYLIRNHSNNNGIMNTTSVFSNLSVPFLIKLSVKEKHKVQAFYRCRNCACFHCKSTNHLSFRAISKLGHQRRFYSYYPQL